MSPNYYNLTTLSLPLSLFLSLSPSLPPTLSLSFTPSLPLSFLPLSLSLSILSFSYSLSLPIIFLPSFLPCSTLSSSLPTSIFPFPFLHLTSHPCLLTYTFLSLHLNSTFTPFLLHLINATYLSKPNYLPLHKTHPSTYPFSFQHCLLPFIFAFLPFSTSFLTLILSLHFLLIPLYLLNMLLPNLLY